METARRRFYNELASRWLPCDDDEDAGDPGRYLLVKHDAPSRRYWFVTFPDLCFIRPFLKRHGWAAHRLIDLDTKQELPVPGTRKF